MDDPEKGDELSTRNKTEAEWQAKYPPTEEDLRRWGYAWQIPTIQKDRDEAARIRQGREQYKKVTRMIEEREEESRRTGKPAAPVPREEMNKLGPPLPKAHLSERRPFLFYAGVIVVAVVGILLYWQIRWGGCTTIQEPSSDPTYYDYKSVQTCPGYTETRLIRENNDSAGSVTIVKTTRDSRP